MQVLVGNPSGTEDVSVREELRGQVADGQFREHDLSPTVDDLLQFLVDNVPLRVDDFLVVLRLVNPDLCILLLTFELKLQVQKTDFGVLEVLGLLLEACVREGFFEGHAVNHEGVLRLPGLP